MTFLLVGVKVKDFTKDFNNKDFIKDFTMVFTNFYGFVKKMVQKNQYTYNVPPGSSANPYGKARSAESPGGTLRSRARRWANCFYFPFYWSRKGYWGFQILSWQSFLKS